MVRSFTSLPQFLDSKLQSLGDFDKVRDYIRRLLRECGKHLELREEQKIYIFVAPPKITLHFESLPSFPFENSYKILFYEGNLRSKPTEKSVEWIRYALFWAL